MKTAIVLGSDSDIAKGIMAMLTADGWSVHGWNRDSEQGQSIGVDWDLMLCALGSVAPVGPWHEQNTFAVKDCFESNFMLPWQLLNWNWRFHKPGASVCFLAGSNPNMIMPGYFAYNCSKMALLKAVEQMDYETPDAKFFSIGPGTILTKIHAATIDSGWDNPKLAAAMADGQNVPAKIARVYDTLKWCMKQDKAAVGGRNICVSDIQLDDMARRLREDTSLWKLRRSE